MNTLLEKAQEKTTGEIEFATFYVGGQLLGVDIRQAQEINRQLDETPAPQAPDYVRGVVNLRGEVVTVLDLGMILIGQPTAVTANSRNFIVQIDGEQIGLLVDRVADVVKASVAQIEPPPANIGDSEHHYYKGVYKLPHEILTILDIYQIINVLTE